ncbi:MAG: hypothetical protein JXA49_07070 [Actinobacteria bacterium]|nr:hypothetical protein [Actinomycetota bacterium]
MEKQILVRNYRIELDDSEHDPETPMLYYAKALIESDVSEVMPYLNTELNYAIYSGDKRFIIWKESGHKISLKPTEMSISKVSCLEEARYHARNAITRINDVWCRRVEIDTSGQKQSIPTPHDLWKLLSGKNCGLCGFKSCMVFAAELIEGNVQPEQCVHLLPDNSNHLEAV